MSCLSDCSPTLTQVVLANCTPQFMNGGYRAADLPATANGTSAATSGNIAVVEGDFTPVSDGTIVARFAREGAFGTISAMPDSYVEYQEI